MKVEITIGIQSRGCSVLARAAGASYHAGSLYEAVVKGCVLAQDGELSRGMVIDADAPGVIEVNGLIELHLEKLVAALFEAIECQPRKVDGVVFRPTLKLCLELADSDSGKCSRVHGAGELAENGGAGQATPAVREAGGERRGVLWVANKPGSGKSLLAKLVDDEESPTAD